MKPKTTRKFYVEWKGKAKWYRSCKCFDSLSKAKTYTKWLDFSSPMRVVEVITTEKVYEV